MSATMDDVELRHKVFTEVSKPHLPVYATVDEAMDAFDLRLAFAG